MRIACFSILISLMVINSAHSQNADIRLLEHIHHQEQQKSDKFFAWTSHSVYPFSLGLPASWLSHGLIADDKTSLEYSWRSSGALVLCTGLTQGLKWAFNRKRPYSARPDLFQAKMHTGPFSFPSGHSSTSFATATALSLAYPRWYVIAPSFLWAGAVAWSRLHLGVHFPSDVLGGMVIGIGSSLIMWKLIKPTN